jgi:hypothetical protein
MNVVCPHCSGTIGITDSTEVVRCPLCQRFFQPLVSPDEPEPRKKSHTSIRTHVIIATVLVLLFCAAAIGILAKNGKLPYFARETSLPTTAQSKPDFTMTAQELYTSYAKTPTNANEMFGGKIVQINGSIVEQGEDASGTFVSFSVSPPARPATPSYDPADQWRQIAAASVTAGSKRVKCYTAAKVDCSPGREMTIRGRCIGLANDLILKECRKVD